MAGCGHSLNLFIFIFFLKLHLVFSVFFLDSNKISGDAFRVPCIICCSSDAVWLYTIFCREKKHFFAFLNEILYFYSIVLCKELIDYT